MSPTELTPSKLSADFPGLVITGNPLDNGLYVATDLTIDAPKFHYGTKFEWAFKTFRYARILGEADTVHGVKAYNNAIVYYGIVYAAVDAGKSVVIINTAATDGYARNGAIAVDELLFSPVVFYNAADTIRQHRTIVGNTAAASGGNFNITLDAPLHSALTATTSHCEICGNPFQYCTYTNEVYSSIMGVPMVDVASGEHALWLQVDGPICTAPGSNTPDPGADAEERQLVFDAQGSIVCMANSSSKDRQHAGFILQRDNVGAGPPFYWLRICK
jgi:hypothetical protein